MDTNRIKFKLNGEEHSVGSEVSADMTLVDYIRNTAELRGTKYMCREGGCGACVVNAVTKEGGKPFGVNACLVSITSCQDWEITTVEKIGNKLDGYHAVQTSLAEKNGTQCGHCSPGWVMSMYSLLTSKKNLTMAEIETSFGGNICRCTGYRSILDAFKKFAIDSPTRCQFEITDIEEVVSSCQSNCEKGCEKNCKNNCDNEDWCLVSEKDIKGTIKFTLNDGKRWFKVYTVDEIITLLQEEDYNNSYMLINGNTAKGVYPIDDYPDLLIDISGVTELKGHQIDQNLIIGAGNTLTEYIEILEQVSTGDFEYLKNFITHLSEVAHIPVRNIGTIAGNLRVKNLYPIFPSDVYLLLEAVGAEVTLVTSTKSKITISLQDFLAKDLTHMVIYNVKLPPLGSNTKTAFFKIASRLQSSRSVTNGGFLYKLNDNNEVLEARIVYGGLSETFIRATETEKYLVGKKLFSNDTIQSGLGVLIKEIYVVEDPPGASAEFRKYLAQALFYKGILRVCPTHLVNPRYQSGATKMLETRQVSSGQQVYDTDSSLWPLNEPVPKLEALVQCSGEAPFTEDLPALPREVFGEFVLSTSLGTIVSMDADKALKIPGVVAFYTAKDIPGTNSFMPLGFAFYTAEEEVLCSGEVKYFNQPIGLIVAETRAIADKAAKLINVVYKDIKKPVIDIQVAKTDSKRNTIFSSVDATDKGTDVQKIIQGTHTVYGQYQFTMETMVSVAKPIEEGLEVYSATQHMDGVQAAIARALKMEQSRIDVITRRLGGGFGMKISRATQGAVACSLVAKLLNRPCRVIQSLRTNMRAFGKRCPTNTNYELAVDKSGVIQYLNYNVYEDNGYKISESLTAFAVPMYNNCYDASRWNFKIYDTVTDTPKNTWCRSPGSFEMVTNAEVFMERISYELSLDPIEVRLANLDQQKFAADIKEVVDTLKTNSQYEERKKNVEKFNKENRWKKRGLRGSVMRWEPYPAVLQLDVNLSVLQGDGTVVITHSGIEMGQGINTKAAQIAAYLLKVPLDKIQVKGNNTVFCPNAQISGGSLPSQLACLGVKRCCDEIYKRLEPIKNSLKTNATWEEICATAYSKYVDLQSHSAMLSTDVQAYNVFGAAFAEVEIDVLTGEHNILRVDIIEDVGQSVNPSLDLGQIEGAFIMGLGFWTTETIQYSEQGEVLTNRAWNYLVPQALDIPQDFRVYFRKNAYSDDIWFGAKTTGEPPFCLSCVIPFALREAIAAARVDAGIPTTDWFDIDGPYIREKIGLSCLTKIEEFKLL